MLEEERKKDIAMPPLEEVQPEQKTEPPESPLGQEKGAPEPPETESSKVQSAPPNETRTEEINTLNVKPPTQQERNFKTLRANKDKLELERNEALEKLAKYEQQKSALKPTLQESDDYGLGLGEDDLAEGKHLKKINAHIQKLEKQINKYQQQSSEIGVETKIKQQYPDFDKIVSKDNIELLRSLHPEIAQTINSSSDLYNKAVSAYTMIKKLGIVTEDNFQQDRALAQKNAAKPKPLSSVSPQQGDSPLSHANAFANGLTDDLKKQLYREMIDAAKKS
jgi:predicted transcriptional regulator